MINRISHWSVNKIYKIFVQLILVYLRWTMVALGILFLIIRNRPPLVTMGFVSVILILFLAIIFAKFVLARLLFQYLYQQLAFDKYIDLLATIYNGRIENKKGNLNALKLGEANVALYRGEFEQALDYISQIDSNNKMYQLHSIFIKGMSYLHLGNEEALKDLLESSPIINLKKYDSEHFLELLEEAIKLTHGEETSYFETTQAKNHLLSIVYRYFQALAAQNQGKTEQAKALFSKIADEKVDLFYVQQARAELKNSGQIV